MDIFGIDATVAGLKRGAEKFGTRVSELVVRRMAKRVNAKLNGYVPQEPEPYGAGMGGADTEQESRIPTQAENSLEDADAADIYDRLTERKLEELFDEAGVDQDYITNSWSQLSLMSKDKLRPHLQEFRNSGVKSFTASNRVFNFIVEAASAEEARKKAETVIGGYAKTPKNIDTAHTWGEIKIVENDGGDISSSALGFQSAQKTTTAQRSKEDAESQSKCQACGFESPNAWAGKCEGCGVKNAEDVGGKLENADAGTMRDAIIGRYSKEIASKNLSGAAQQAIAKLAELIGESAQQVLKDLSSDARYLEDRENAGHLGPDAWLAASLEERILWLERAGMDVNLATRDFSKLSLDVHVALQDAMDMPGSRNDIRPVNHEFDYSLTNASGKPGTKEFTFRDSSGEDHAVDAISEQQAWQELSKDFATSISDMKGFGIKLVSTRENAEPERCPKCNHQFAWHMSRSGCDGTGADGNVCGCKEPQPLKNASGKCKSCGKSKPELGPDGTCASCNGMDNAAGDRLSGADCTCGHAGAQHHDTGKGEACARCDCDVYDPAITCRKCGQKERQGVAVGGLCEECQNSKENAKAQEPCATCGLPKQMRPDGGDENSFVCGNRRCASFKNADVTIPEEHLGKDTGDLEEIARHAEGIEHEVSEMLTEDAPLLNSLGAGVARGSSKYGTRNNYSTEDQKDELLEQIRMKCGSGSIGQDKAKQAARSILQDAKGDFKNWITSTIGNEFDLQHYIENL